MGSLSYARVTFISHLFTELQIHHHSLIRMNTYLLEPFFFFSFFCPFALVSTVCEELSQFWKAKFFCVLLSHCKIISCGRERSVRGVQMGKSAPLRHVQLANQVQEFYRIPDR